MKKTNFQKGLLRLLMVSVVLIFMAVVSNGVYAQSVPQAAKVIQTELNSMRAASQAGVSHTVASSDVALRVKIEFYTIAIDMVEKYGVSNAAQETYNLFTQNNNDRNGVFAAARDDLNTLLQGL